MSALGQKRTFRWVRVMSAILPKADIRHSDCRVRFVPKADIRPNCENAQPSGSTLWTHTKS